NANTYTGATNVNAGTLTGANNSAVGNNSAVTVASGATLAVQGAAGPGLPGAYYNETPQTTFFTDLPTINAHFATLTPALTSNSLAAGPNFDFQTNGSGFPAPYNAGGGNSEVVWRGEFSAATSGTYLFGTSSDDGSMLFIDGTTVVNNNFFQGV